MKTYSSFILCLMCISQAHSKDFVIVRESEAFVLQISSKTMTRDYVTKCELVTPDTKVYQVFPTTNLPFYATNFTNYSSDEKTTCAVSISPLTASLTGLYQLKFYEKENTASNSTYLRVQVPTPLWPKRGIRVSEGEDFFVYLKANMTNMTECRVIFFDGSNMTDILLLENKTDSFIKYKGSGYKQGECGFQASGVTVANTGTWSIYTFNSSNHSYVADMDITVFNETYNIWTNELLLGSNSNTYVNPEGIKYCLTKDSDGIFSKIEKKNCVSSIITPVTDYDAGNYSYRIALEGRMREVDTTLILSVHQDDKPSETHKEVKTLVTKSESGEWNLLCRMLIGDSSDEASFCRFLHPNGTGLLMTDGVGNSQYSYYGEGLNSKSYRDCGITIHKPTVADNGVWNCYIYWNEKLRIGRLQVNTLNDGFVLPIPSRVSGSANMIVMEGTILEIYCQIDAILDYCWFLRPNGSQFVPDYDAADLKLGKCSARTVQMNRNDSGEWVCNMGIMGHPEGDLKHSFNVTVATSRLMAKTAHQKAKLKESTTLHCVTAPATKTLNYCRFVRPDGVGISPARTSRTILDRYTSTGGSLEKGDCLLTIDEVTSRDFGHWRCAAIIQGEDEEIYDRFTLVQSEDDRPINTAAISGIAVGVAALAASVTFIVYYVLKKNRQRFMQRLAQPGDNISVTSSDTNSNDGIQITQRERHEMSQLNIATHTYS